MANRNKIGSDPFNERNQLRGPWQAAIRQRLQASGVVGFDAQCGLLSRCLGTVDDATVWAMLLWNSSVAGPDAERVRAWIRGGMRLSEPNGVTGPWPGARAKELPRPPANPGRA